MDHFATGGKLMCPGYPTQFHGYPAWDRLTSQAAQQKVPALVKPLAAGDEARGGTFDLVNFYDPAKVEAWDSDRFKFVRKLQNATRNKGQVFLVNDTTTDTPYAVKQMPNDWIKENAAAFKEAYPRETEQPWVDVSCISYLNSIEFQYACDLVGVYRDDEFTYVVQTFAPIGDLFSWCDNGPPPGPAWEEVVRPVLVQVFQAVREFHDLGLVHRDLSLENVLLAPIPDDLLQCRLIDFGMVRCETTFQNCLSGKASYQAPEMHGTDVFNGALSDAFSFGVLVYTVLMKDYPWFSTKAGGCKCFEYVQKHGLRSFWEKRKVRNQSIRVSEALSEPVKELLEGLLATNPEDRLTLGERQFGPARKSVWDMGWLQSGFLSDAVGA